MAILAGPLHPNHLSPFLRSANVRTGLRYVVQLLITLLVVCSPLQGLLKVVVLLGWWRLSFGPVTKRESVLYVSLCAFFTLMNYQSLRNGIFAFSEPAFLNMPWYEFLMWGFYALHTKRILKVRHAERPTAGIWLLALGYAAAFVLVSNPQVLLVVTTALLLFGLCRYPAPGIWTYTGYMILLGAAVEYAGVWAGEWFYPSPPPGGVPFWFVTLWGGVGFFWFRLVLPLAYPKGCSSKEQAMKPTLSECVSRKSIKRQHSAYIERPTSHMPSR